MGDLELSITKLMEIKEDTSSGNSTGSIGDLIMIRDHLIEIY